MQVAPISIIIPVFNASKSISVIVSSIMNQTFQNFELILVDDGSTDNTLNILRGIKKGDSRIIIRSQKNKGPSGARNAGLEKVSGKYVVFFDADDNIAPNTLEILVSTMENTRCDLLVSGWQVHVGDYSSKNDSFVHPIRSSVTGNDIKKYVLRSVGDDNHLYNLWNKVYRSDIIKQHNLRFREDTRFGEDLIFSFHYLRHVTQINLIPDSLYHYRVGNATSVFSKSARVPKYRKINVMELEKFVGDVSDRELDDLLQWVKWRWLLSYYLIVGKATISRGEKIKLIKSNLYSQPVVAKNSTYIGKKKLMLEHLGHTLQRSPRLALLFGKMTHTSRKYLFGVNS